MILKEQTGPGDAIRPATFGLRRRLKYFTLAPMDDALLRMEPWRGSIQFFNIDAV
jgi:hypothetical protein